MEEGDELRLTTPTQEASGGSTGPTPPAVEDGSGEGAGGDAPRPDGGIVRALAELPPGAILDEAAVARIFARCPMSIKRAVQRGELPPPVRMFGRPCWTAGAILGHLDARLEAARREAERDAARIRQFRP